MGVFAQWQPQYAARAIPTFPVTISHDRKKPSVRNYLEIGLPGSGQLAERYGVCDAFGFALGARSKITVLDVDTSDESVLRDALTHHGTTPIVVRSGSGNFHAWYRHAGEPRMIRPWGRANPIDLLGAGYVVAPPSIGHTRNYEIIIGSLDDLARLPALRNLPPGILDRSKAHVTAREGHRNNALFRACMAQAGHCDNFDTLLDVARSRNGDYMPPLDDAEVMQVAQSAWGYTERGENRFGQRGAWLPADAIDEMASDPYLIALIAWLRAKNGKEARFWVADGLCKILRWPLRQLREARRRAIQQGWIVMARKPVPGCPAEYCWGPRATPIKSDS